MTTIELPPLPATTLSLIKAFADSTEFRGELLRAFEDYARLAVEQDRARGWKVEAWIDNSGHPKHVSYVQSAKERQLYGRLRPLYLHP